MIGLCVCPFFDRGSDESLGFSVGFWGVGFGSDVLNAPSFQYFFVAFFVAHAVIGHDALYANAVLFEASDSAFGEGE